MIELSTSWDDGTVTDLRLADLLKKYRLPAIFYIPTCCEILPDHIRDLSNFFEIGGHTKTHPMDMKHLSRTSIRTEVYDNKVWLERLTGKDVNKFCYPRGRYNAMVIEVLKEVGFIEARTTVIGHTQQQEDRYRINTTVHAFNRPEYKGQDWLEYAVDKFKQVIEADKRGEMAYYHLWGHSKEINLNDDWDRLEELFKMINEHIYTK